MGNASLQDRSFPQLRKGKGKGHHHRRDGGTDAALEAEQQAELRFLESLPNGWVVPGADSPYWEPDLDPREEYIGSHLMEESPELLFEILKSDEKLHQASERAAELGREYDSQTNRSS
jgi:hypothetical protein